MSFKDNVKNLMKKNGKAAGKQNKGMTLPQLQKAAKAQKGAGGKQMPQGFPVRK